MRNTSHSDSDGSCRVSKRLPSAQESPKVLRLRETRFLFRFGECSDAFLRNDMRVYMVIANNIHLHHGSCTKRHSVTIPMGACTVNVPAMTGGPFEGIQQTLSSTTLTYFPSRLQTPSVSAVGELHDY